MQQTDETLLLSNLWTLDEMKLLYVAWAIRRHHGNRTAAAKALGISVRRMHHTVGILKDLGIVLPDHGNSPVARKMQYRSLYSRPKKLRE